MIKKLLFPLLLVSSLFISAQQSYYDDVDLTKTGTDLKDELATKITNTHSNYLSYSDVWNACKATDVNPYDSSEILLVYGYTDDTNDTALTDDIDNQNTGGTTGWNREHTFPKSLGNPNLGTSGPGSDAHHLRPSDVQYNALRGSDPFATGSGDSGVVTNGWYPGDEWKGDIARMMMYMYLRYGEQCLPSTVGIGDSSATPDEMIDLFLTWNAEDPVSLLEDNRNTFHENTTNTYAQGNRNPFIDNPNLATQIWGGDVAENRWDSSTPDDTENPTIATSLVTSNITSESVTLSWTSATDNIGVIAYEVFVNGISNVTTGSTSINIEELDASTAYSFYVITKDAAGNTSENSETVSATTLEETVDTTEYCTTESFENIVSGSSSYSDRSWVGDNGEDWSATDARTDQSLSDGSKAITVREGVITTGEVTGGISSFTVKTKRVFGGGNGTFDLNVNQIKVGEIPFSDEEQTIVINDINIEGNVTISITNNLPTGTTNRVVFDDLKWTCFDGSTASVNDINSLVNLKIYPNPSTSGTTTILYNSNTKIENITVYSIIGKKVSEIINPVLINNRYTLDNLKSSIYLVKINTNKKSTTKKLVIQ